MTDTPAPDTQGLRALRDQHDDRFEQVIEKAKYDHAGMWYSELFAFVLMCEHLDCNKIIESGRARGISTQVISNYFRGSEIEITSIDNRPESGDAQIAEEKLSTTDNVTLKYGDSTEIVPNIADKETAVLIDGPKGDTALQMAIELLEYSNVPIVAVHDLYKDRFPRDISELLFNSRMYTDQEELVELFRQYDDPVFQWNKNTHSKESIYGPYRKDGKESHSYGPTLGLFFNNSPAVDQRVKENYLEYYDVDMIDIARKFKQQQTSGGEIRAKVAELGWKIGKKIIR